MPVISCSKCGTKNRVELARATDGQAKCGKCGTPLDISKVAAQADDKKPLIVTDATFERDVLLQDTEPMVRRLAEKVWSASQKESRIAHTVVLKLKTSEFNILTRSHTPPTPPSSLEDLIEIVVALMERADSGLELWQRFRLVGVGLSNFREPQDQPLQSSLFE